MRTHTWNRTSILFALLILAPGCGLWEDGRGADRVVVYTALDREFSGPLLQDLGDRAGVEVLPKFDIESTKTVGLTKLILAESANPRCDLFWNNEILNTLRLRQKGLLEPFHPHLREPYHIPGGSGREVGARSDPENLPAGQLVPRRAPEFGMGKGGRVMRTHT